MYIVREIKKFIVSERSTIKDALLKIKNEKGRIVFIVNEKNKFLGLLTLGDFTRWLIDQDSIDLNTPVISVANTKCIKVRSDDSSDRINEIFLNSNIHFVPILDNYDHLVAVATRFDVGINIGNYEITNNSQTFIIAEIGNNHNGDFKLAKRLVDLAVASGADCAKFQMRDMESLYKSKGRVDDSEDLGTQYTLDLLSRVQLKKNDLFKLFDYCIKKKIEPLCTPWDSKSVNDLEEYGVNAFKVASADLTNHELLKYISETKKPMLCSTGMSTEWEIDSTVKLLQSLGSQFILLHCNSTYPAPYKDINLKYITHLKNKYECLVGYSGHERGIYIPVAAVSLGAKVIEKHFTVDRNMEGNDHKVSLLPNEFSAMVKGIRIVEEALGSSRIRKISQGELINRENLAKSLIINCDLEAGNFIREEMIEIRSPGKGLPPYRKSELVGTVAKRDFKALDFFYPSDIVDDKEGKPRKYSFTRPWGIPVRFHDWSNLVHKTNLDFVEFHLSYKDLGADLNNFFKNSSLLNFTVHSPELFMNDHVMDLCCEDDGYRNHSLHELERVIDITLRLKKFFPNTARPMIVINAGGFSRNGFLNEEAMDQAVSRLKHSLAPYVSDKFEIIPQTMPPFPWHFGGQAYHNVFVDPKQIAGICRELDLRICFDSSHSQLACNYFKWAMEDFIKEIGQYTAHMHIADAAGLDGEGLQIHDGTVDFSKLSSLLDQHASYAWFIPEIWQGHKNEGEGFWIALNRLEETFE